MALDVLEWGVILVMGAGILIWGPEKIPEIAKTLARAKKEFDGATKQLQGITKELQTGLSSGNLNLDNLSNVLIGTGTGTALAGAATPEQIAAAGATPVGPLGPNGTPVKLTPLPQIRSADQILIEMAKAAGVPTQGMTREEVSKAIMQKVNARDAVEAPPVEAPLVEPTPVEAPAASSTETTASAPAQVEVSPPAPTIQS